MFKCSVSGRISKPGEKQYKITTKTRKRDYYEDRTDEKRVTRNVLVGHGYEIVEEKVVCKEVYDKVNNVPNKG